MITVIITLFIVSVLVISVSVYLYNYKKNKRRKELHQYVLTSIGEKKENKRLHYLLRSEYENCLNSLDLAMLLPDSLVCVKDKIMMALTLSNDETVRTLSAKFFDIADKLHAAMNTGLVNDFADCESMLDLLREKFIELIIGECSIEEILDTLNKTEENVTVLYEIAKRRANGDYRCFKRVDLDSWSRILDNALNAETIGNSNPNNVTELLSTARIKIG